MGANPRTLFDLTRGLFPEFAAIADAWKVYGQQAGSLSPTITLRLNEEDLVRVSDFLSAVLNIMAGALQGRTQLGPIVRRITREEVLEVCSQAAWVLLAFGAWLSQEGRMLYTTPPPAAPGDGGQEKRP